MSISKSELKSFLGTLIYHRALDYYTSDRVGDLNITKKASSTLVRANIIGEFSYDTSAEFFSDGRIRIGCNCPAFDAFGKCKHVGALILKYLDEQKNEEPAQYTPRTASSSSSRRKQNSPAGNLLLQSYLSLPSASVRIEPSLSMNNSSLSLSFSIGSDYTYVVRNLHQLCKAFQTHETITYGVKFTYAHNVSDLDETSRRLLRLIQAYVKSITPPYSAPPAEKDIPLDGWTLDEFFDICMDQPVKSRDGKQSWSLRDGDPALSMNATDADGNVNIAFDPMPTLYQGARHDYLVINTFIYRLSESYAQAVVPALSATQSGAVILSPNGAQDFCENVLPKISKFVPMQNEENALTAYMPMQMDVRYYLDLPERGTMTAQPFFSYGETLVQPEDPIALHTDIRRDGAKERAAVQALLQHFDPPKDKNGLYTLTDEDRMYDFLSQGADKLAETGEVFLSERLKNAHQKKPVHMSVGVSTGDSVLNLHLDTGEFPLDELEELMTAMRQKRKYYRMKDGQFMDIVSGNLGDLSNIADGLGLNPTDLEKGNISVPMTRAMYLDNALKEDASLSVQRDASFRHIVRDFRTVEDSDFAVPEPLDKVLRNYQQTGYRWLRTLDAYRFGGILADDMGLGKTLQVLTYLLSIARQRQNASQPGPRASLIVCPASLVINWGQEAQKWTPELNVCLLSGNAVSREMDIMNREQYDILVTSYDLMKRDVEFHKKANYYACILDEAQYIKNHETKGSKAVKEVNAMVKIAMTGTPVENRLSELWSIFDFLMPGYLYKYATFKSRFETPIVRDSDKKAQETLRRLVSPFILRRMKKDVLSELPPKVETQRFVQMEEVQRKTYLAYAWDLKKKLAASDGKDKIQILSMLTRLRQLCCDPALCVENYTGGSCKLDECIRLLQNLTENGHSVLVFSQFTAMLARIRDRLDEMHIDSFTLQGDTPRDMRAELVTAFNEGEVPVFLISLKAGGTGLNLTAADTVIHYDPWWNIAAQNQATDRCYRIGQKRKVQVYQLIAKDTIEENILKLQTGKRDLADRVVENADGGIMSMSTEELMDLVDSEDELPRE